MRRLRVTARVDLEAYYRADCAFYRDRPALLQAMTLERFHERYGHCPSLGFELDGQAVGGVILDGDEVHIAVLSEAHGRWAPLLGEALQWLFSQRSAVLGRIDPANHRCIALIERLGGRPLTRRADSIVYLLRPPARMRKAVRHQIDCVARDAETHSGV